MARMSKVTLLGPPGATYLIGYGAREYLFVEGQARKVPVVIALEARKKRDRKGHALFSVEDLPEIVNSAPSTASDPAEESEQTVPAEAQQTFGI